MRREKMQDHHSGFEVLLHSVAPFPLITGLCCAISVIEQGLLKICSRLTSNPVLFVANNIILPLVTKSGREPSWDW
jgi:hypothetical protein